MMKIDRFNEVKKIKDTFLGEESLPIEVNLIFRVSKSQNNPDKYSLRARIDGDINTWNSAIFLGSGLTKEQIGEKKLEYLNKISLIHKNSDKFNI